MKVFISILIGLVVNFSAYAQGNEETINDWVIISYPQRDGLDMIASNSKQNPTAILILRCMNEKFDVIFNITGGLEFSNQEKQNITIRRDKGRMVIDSWNLGSDQTYVYVSEPLRFAKSLLKTQELVLGYHTDKQKQRSEHFDMKGFEQVYEKMVNACNLE